MDSLPHAILEYILSYLTQAKDCGCLQPRLQAVERVNRLSYEH